MKQNVQIILSKAIHMLSQSQRNCFVLRYLAGVCTLTREDGEYTHSLCYVYQPHGQECVPVENIKAAARSKGCEEREGNRVPTRMAGMPSPSKSTPSCKFIFRSCVRTVPRQSTSFLFWCDSVSISCAGAFSCREHQRSSEKQGVSTHKLSLCENLLRYLTGV
jgi:hypothetical protein